MNGKAPPDRDELTRTEAEGETLDMPEGPGAFTKGQVLGERYQIIEMLGRGGMGEVWQAFDLKLRVEVALKALRPEFFKSERRLELLRQEVRAAREVVSPNVCRIFDLIEIEGRELVSMEYVNGATLLGVLQERGPLELKEAQDIASQFLAGLEAIHKVGLVHRDIKPENVMLTRAGRVVVMDFGLARQEAEGGGSVSGTPAYMSPEQAAGETLDARADVYSAGVVLAEMVCPDGIKNIQSRQSVWKGVRSEPAKVSDTPWAEVIKKAIAKDRDRRFNTAHTLTRALEDVTLRVEGAEDLHPYPGLASFTEADAEYFFGREAEVEQMWRRLEGPPRMLALVGPSGAGKTSFLRAGVFPAATARWATAICKPGSNPQLSLGRALAPTMAGDTEVMDLLLRFDDPDVAVEVLSRWRLRHEHALLVVDQFEELFTQNSPDVQQRFAGLLGRLVLEADVHVLLSMRDDFMIRCRDFEALQPTFADLTALPTLSGAALRRALTQPALQCGYRFEDDELVDEMHSEVEGERGALPLLAFAAARLWEKRDRETGLLTRQAYEDIGGVGGALARHAEATIDQIGHQRLPVVRELFRNLVTAEGTRAVREWDELLSVFSDSQSESPAAVLRALIDARLLTSYEVREEDSAPTRRVEIIHESLLANWPRLVRWQTQDADAAQLRDQLRQAARTWDDQGRSDDTLWTGSAYREFASWRERYPGGLTEIEDAFAAAMTSFATRRRRRRRIAVASFIIMLLAVLAVVGVSRQQAVAEARRAEAQKLIVLGEVKLEDFPTAAMAWATASLELADSREARLLALRALAEGPPATLLKPPEQHRNLLQLAFSPNGKWMAGAGLRSTHLWFYEGTPPMTFEELDEAPDWIRLAFSSNDRLIIDLDGTHRWWSIPDVREPVRVDENRGVFKAVRGDGYYSYQEIEGEKTLVWWPVDGGDRRVLGAGDTLHEWFDEIDPTGSRLAFFDGKRVMIRDLENWDAEPRLIGELESDSDGGRLAFAPDGSVVAAVRDHELRIWPVGDGAAEPPRVFTYDDIRFYDVEFGPNGSWLMASTLHPERGQAYWIFDLDAPWGGAEPVKLRKSLLGYDNRDQTAVHPSGDWLVTSDSSRGYFWPMTHRHPWIFDIRGRIMDVAFSPDGEWLLSLTDSGETGTGQLRAWPLARQNDGESRLLFEQPAIMFFYSKIVFHPSGDRVALGAQSGKVFVVSIAGADVRELTWPGDLKWEAGNLVVSFSPDGRHLAATPHFSDSNETPVYVWDLMTDGVRPVGTIPGPTGALRFVDEGRLLWAGGDEENRSNVEKVFDLRTGEETVVSLTRRVEAQTVSPDGSSVLTIQANQKKRGEFAGNTLVWEDQESGESRAITTHGDRDQISVAAFDPSGQWIVSSGYNKPVHVGPVSGDEPYLLFGHDGLVTGLAVSPDGKWIASGGYDKTLRLWPTPDPSKPPLHTLPLDKLIAKLKTLTNIRFVRDEESTTGWDLEIAPFPGWAEVPEW